MIEDKLKGLATINTSITSDAIEAVQKITVPGLMMPWREVICSPTLHHLSRERTGAMLEIAYGLLLPQSVRLTSLGINDLPKRVKALLMELSIRRDEIRLGTHDHLERVTILNQQEGELMFRMGGVHPSRSLELWWSNPLRAAINDGAE